MFAFQKISRGTDIVLSQVLPCETDTCALARAAINVAFSSWSSARLTGHLEKLIYTEQLKNWKKVNLNKYVIVDGVPQKITGSTSDTIFVIIIAFFILPFLKEYIEKAITFFTNLLNRVKVIRSKRIKK